MTHACATPEPGVEIETLSFSEQFLVWSVRAWVDGYKAGTGRAGLLREGFALAGATDGWLLVEELMSIIASTARRPLDVLCLACRSLGDDEAPAAVTVGNWLPPSAARVALALLTRLASELRQAGMRLPVPMPMPMPIRVPDRGLALVH